MDGLHFIYFADPMCSWCWGFAPGIAGLKQRYEGVLDVRVVLGGLRPGTEKPMTEAAKADTRHHWEHVHEASGQPFDYAFFDREGFKYDTDPAARAVVLARRANPDLALVLLERIQRAFYAENRDVTDFEVLADLAQEFGLDRAAFLTGLSDEQVKFETWRDYGLSQRAGVTGFPTLVVGPQSDGTFVPVTRGFQPPEVVTALVDSWLGAVRVAS